MTQNLPKKGKISFDKAEADFCWNIGPDSMNSENDENYRKLLRNNYRYNPALHEFDSARFWTIDE